MRGNQPPAQGERIPPLLYFDCLIPLKNASPLRWSAMRTYHEFAPIPSPLAASAGAILSGAPSQITVDLRAIAHNTRWIKARIGADVALMAVVKANAYGHGAEQVARAALAQGADMLAVANLEEAAALRQAGINAPILLLSYIPPRALPRALKLGLTVSLYDARLADSYQAAAQKLGTRLPVHVKVDSGMGRLGLTLPEVAALCRRLRALPNIRLDGLYTHFASADDDPDFTALQLRRFQRVLADARGQGAPIKFVHAANSAALLNSPGSVFNLARAGLLLYGLNPAPVAASPRGLQPALTWRTRIAQLKTLPPGSPVGYGKAYHTRGTETIAILPVGYADGLRRSPLTWRQVLVRGRRAPLVGRVSMEKITIDVSHIPDAAVDDEVVLLGRQGADVISAEEIAGWLDTISYEVVATLAPRAPRRYING